MKKKKTWIICICFIAIFGVWIDKGPNFIASFRQEGEAEIKETNIETVGNDYIEYQIDNIAANSSSYREMVEVSGYAFYELDEKVKNRSVEVALISNRHDYSIMAQMIKNDELMSRINAKLVNKDIQPIQFKASFSGMPIKNGEYQVVLIVDEDNSKQMKYTKFILTKDAGKINIKQDFETDKQILTQSEMDLSTYKQAVGSIDKFEQKDKSIFYAYGWAMNKLSNVENRSQKIYLVSEERQYVGDCTTIERYGLIQAIDPTIQNNKVISPAFEVLFDLENIEDGQYDTYILVEENGENYLLPCNKVINKSGEGIQIVN